MQPHVKSSFMKIKILLQLKEDETTILRGILLICSNIYFQYNSPDLIGIDVYLRWSAPLSLSAPEMCIKNWDRIALREKCNFLELISYENSLQRLVWPNRIKNCLSSIGIQNVKIATIDNTQKTFSSLFT